MENIKLLHTDCMEYMASLPDNAFNLAIVDPPYRDKNQPTKEMRNKINGNMKNFGQKPDEKYFKELFRISENQIVWGANNFIEHLYSTNGFIFWYKRNPMKNYSDGELAWTSFNCVARCLSLDHFGNHTADEIKYHPTQKPVQLYKWLLMNYAKEGDTIFDSHGGSMSLAIAAHDLGFDCTICEIDRDYYDAAVKRFNQHKAQLVLF